MEQVHRRFTAEHVRNLFRGYSSGLLDRAAVEEVLGIGKTRFFALLKLYRKDPERSTLIAGFPSIFKLYSRGHIHPGQEVELHLLPNLAKESVEIRVWWKETMI